MKKLISILLVCTFLLGALAGCQGGTQTPEQSQSAGGASPSGTGSPSGDTPSNTGAGTAANPDEPRYGGRLRMSLHRIVKSLDPIKGDSTCSGQIMHELGDTLIMKNENQDGYYPSIAKEWKISDDGLTYTFYLRDDVYFHKGQFQDGRKMVASDVVYTLNRSRGYMSNYLAGVEDITAPDDTTVVITLDQPRATFLYSITSRTNTIVCPEEVEGWGEEFGNHVVATGAFELVEHVPDSYTLLRRNENYWGQKPYLDEIEFVIITDATQNINALLTGEIHATVQVQGEKVPEIQKAPGINLLQCPAFNINHVGFNTVKEGPLQNRQVREAMIRAVDYEQLVAGVYKYGEAGVSRLPLPKISWGYDESLEYLVPSYDVAEAKRLLTEAGYPDGFKTSINFVTSDTSLQIATILQQFWKQNLNVDVEIRSTDSATHNEIMLGGNFDILIGQQGGSGDPGTTLGYFFSTEKLGSNYNYWGYSDPEADRIAAAALAENDQEKRKELYRELMIYAVPECVAMFHSTNNYTWAVSDKVKGVVQLPDSSWNIADSRRNCWLAE